MYPHGVFPAVTRFEGINTNKVGLKKAKNYKTPSSEDNTRALASLSVIMATTTPSHQTAPKPTAEQIDTISLNDNPTKPQHHAELDKFGASAKSDPAEIALVRKIDLYMIPILWLMYCKCLCWERDLRNRY